MLFPRLVRLLSQTSVRMLLKGNVASGRAWVIIKERELEKVALWLCFAVCSAMRIDP